MVWEKETYTEDVRKEMSVLVYSLYRIVRGVIIFIIFVQGMKISTHDFFHPCVQL